MYEPAPLSKERQNGVEDPTEMTYTVGSSRSPLATEGLCLQVQGHGLGTMADKVQELALDGGYSTQFSWNAFKAVLLGGI